MNTPNTGGHRQVPAKETMNSETTPTAGTCTSEPPYWSNDDNGQSPERDRSVYVFIGGCALCALFGGVIGWCLNGLL